MNNIWDDIDVSLSGPVANGRHVCISLTSEAAFDGTPDTDFDDLFHARVRAVNVLGRLAVRASQPVGVARASHGCEGRTIGNGGDYDCRDGECGVMGSWQFLDPADDLCDEVTLYLSVPQDQANLWLCRVEEWLTTILNARPTGRLRAARTSSPQAEP